MARATQTVQETPQEEVLPTTQEQETPVDGVESVAVVAPTPRSTEILPSGNTALYY